MTNGRVGAGLRSRAWQTAGVVLTVAAVAAMNRQSDGLWFQGDAPRHAANGLFWWDLLSTLPRDPVDYAVRYYARYPAIAPASYPPLFYILEGLAFAVFGPSPFAARVLVLLCAAAAGLYTMAWARRWIDPVAGWSGTFLAFTPAMVLWSNAVMLNVPATAAGLASLYHFRRWLETSGRDQLALSVVFVTIVLLTYYPSASVLPVLAAWALLDVRGLRVNRKFVWAAAAGVIASVPLLAALRLAPVHTSRHLPTLGFLSAPGTWTYYWRALPGVIGGAALALGLAGCAAGILDSRRRSETTHIIIWIAVLIAGLSLLPARDPRYVLLAAPAFVLAGAIGVGIRSSVAARAAPRVASRGVGGRTWGRPVVSVRGSGAGRVWLSRGRRLPSGYRSHRRCALRRRLRWHLWLLRSSAGSAVRAARGAGGQAALSLRADHDVRPGPDVEGRNARRRRQPSTQPIRVPLGRDRSEPSIRSARGTPPPPGGGWRIRIRAGPFISDQRRG